MKSFAYCFGFVLICISIFVYGIALLDKSFNKEESTHEMHRLNNEIDGLKVSMGNIMPSAFKGRR